MKNSFNKKAFKPGELIKADFQHLTHTSASDFKINEFVCHKSSKSLLLKIERFTYDGKIECSYSINENKMEVVAFIPEELLKLNERSIIRLRVNPYYTYNTINLN
jgi:hypothetical protein